MAFPATVLNVLIASPSDLPETRDAITEVLHAWTALHGRKEKIVLLPVRWETHSVPEMGDTPQELLNDQFVKNCDMLIGAFFTRLGSPTGKEDSGTVEEIKWFLSQNKPVMLYFSDAPLPNDCDLDQVKKLREFKASIRGKGIQEEYSTIAGLKEKLMRHLTLVVERMSTGPVIDKKAVRDAQETAKAPLTGTKTVPTPRAADSESAEIYLEDYTDKAFLVRGDARDFSDKLKATGGRWISTSTGPRAWMFSKKHLEKIAKILGIKPTMRKAG